MSTLRDKILSAKDIESKIIKIEEWGADIEIRSMTAGERARLLDAAIDAKGKVSMSVLYPGVVLACAYDPETGEKVFTPEDRELLDAKSAAAVEKIAKVALELSGLDIGSVDAAQKN